MLVLHSWTTPNGRKVPILLEELGLAYEVHFVDISKNEQFEPDFLAISPNNKIPALVDYGAEDGPLSIFESGAILTYLADKYGRFLAPRGHARWKAMEWLNWQIGSLGPMLGQLGFFAVRSKEKAPLAIDRFTEEAGRLLGVLERRLGEARYLAGDDYTIADIAAYPWMVAATTVQKDVLADVLAGKEAIARWMAELAARPAVQRGMAIKPPPRGIS
ncbi:MAG: glutathione S-transferase N-terminal domain-containing protein [Sphingomonas oligoaromativorans]